MQYIQITATPRVQFYGTVMPTNRTEGNYTNGHKHYRFIERCSSIVAIKHRSWKLVVRRVVRGDGDGGNPVESAGFPRVWV